MISQSFGRFACDPGTTWKGGNKQTAAKDLKSTNLTKERENSNDFLVIEVFNFFAYQTPSLINNLNLILKIIFITENVSYVP